MSNRRRQFLKTTTAAGMLGFMPKAFSAAEQPSKGLSAKLEKLMKHLLQKFLLLWQN